MKPSATKCVFVVDDDEDDCYLINQVFKQSSPDYSLKFMANGHELLLKLEASEALPSLIVLDLNMPFMNGFEALRRLRQQPRYNAISVIILTTSQQVEDHQQALTLKANGFFTKLNTMQAFHKLVLELHQQYLEGRCVDTQGLPRN